MKNVARGKERRAEADFCLVLRRLELPLDVMQVDLQKVAFTLCLTSSKYRLLLPKSANRHTVFESYCHSRSPWETGHLLKNISINEGDVAGASPSKRMGEVRQLLGYQSASVSNVQIVDPWEFGNSSPRPNTASCCTSSPVQTGSSDADGCGSKLSHQGTAGFSLWFHLPGKPVLGLPYF